MNSFKKRLFFILSISVILCNCKDAVEDNAEVSNAKWYFYCFANKLSAYNFSDTINSLECGLILAATVHGDIADSIYFKAFYIDTNKICRFRPFNLDGVAVTKTKIYSPIFHGIVYDDSLNDAASLNYMQEMEKLLINKINENTDRINPWLVQEAKKRAVIN